MITLEKENAILTPICQLNVSMFWAGIIAEVLERSGVKYVVSSPGSRSAPLTIACASHKNLKTIPVLDERSAGFFALGLAKRSRRPVALICSSGTAAANFYPAIIEARMTRVPLIVLTADRPPELRECHSGQTIDQVKLYGGYPLFYKELAVPQANFDLFYYLRQTVAHACERSLFPQAGPVHLNVPITDPYPVRDEGFVNFLKEFDADEFFNSVVPVGEVDRVHGGRRCEVASMIEELRGVERGLIVVGTVQPGDPEGFSRSVGQLARALGWPVLGEGLSPVRNYAKEVPGLITRYDTILRNADAAECLRPERVIQVGDLPTSKVLRTWLKELKPRTWVIEESADNIDALHGNTRYIRCDIEDLVADADSGLGGDNRGKDSGYFDAWKRLEKQVNLFIDNGLMECSELFEGKIAWLLSQRLPEETPVFIATSMPVRDVEFFWKKGDRRIQPYFNRGANGIDGIVSTALGVAHGNRPSVLLVGDLTLLHDGNGLLIKNYFEGSLTIVLINNDGGRIFENMPVAQCGTVFEEYIATPQGADFKKFADYHGLKYFRPDSWEAFTALISELPSEGIRIIEMVTDGKKDVAFRRNLFKDISEKIVI